MTPRDMLPATAKPAKIRLTGNLDPEESRHLVGPGVYADNNAFHDDEWELVMVSGDNWIGDDLDGKGIDAFVLSDGGDCTLCAVIIKDGYSVSIESDGPRRMFESRPCEFLIAFLIDSRFVETKKE